MSQVFIKNIFLATLAWLCIGCATVEQRNPKDPLESYNRSMFMVNSAIDQIALKPLAKGYVAVVPAPVRECVSGVFENLKLPFSALNSLLQGKPAAACDDFARFVVNTTVGLGGCFDPATALGMPANHKEDFGQTLAVWGVPSGPYVVLPFFGPSTVRDGVAQFAPIVGGAPVDRNVISSDIHNRVPTRNVLLGVNLVNVRANLLPATDALEKMSVDHYAFVRDGYQRRRMNQIYDGNPPDEDDDKPEPKKSETKP